MNKSLEDMIKEVVSENAKQIAGKLLTMSDLSVAQIAEITELSLDDVQQVSDGRRTVVQMANSKSQRKK